jgi:hypothetical protein
MAEEDMVGDERRECKEESAERRLRAGLRQGLRLCFFPHRFPPVSPFWVDHNLDDVKQYVRIPATLFLNPCYHPASFSNNLRAVHVLLLVCTPSQSRVYAELHLFRTIDATHSDTTISPWAISPDRTSRRYRSLSGTTRTYPAGTVTAE